MMHRRVQKFDDTGTFLGKWGSTGFGEDQFMGAFNVAVDGDGDVYVVDNALSRIKKFDGNGTFLGSWGGRGTCNGRLALPSGIAVDGGGNVYVASQENERIDKFTCP